MRKIAALLLICQLLDLSAQVKPLENVFLHLSSTNVISGEYLHFSAYTYSEASGKVIELSRILYVEIIDDRGESVIKSKIKLSDGRGSGKIFIPTELSTGIYFVSGYTRWMKNTSSWFRQPLTIVNPYLSYYSSDNTGVAKYVPEQIETLAELDSLSQFEKTSPLSFEIPVPDSASLSVAVSRLHNHFFKNEFKAMDYLEIDQTGQLELYPEFQYGVIQGTTRAPNSWITLSLQSEMLEVDATQADADGNFSLIYDPSSLTSGFGSLKVKDSAGGDFVIVPEYYDSYPSANVRLEFTHEDLEEIKQRSINSQLLNAYYQTEVLNDTSGRSSFIPLGLSTTYWLDEYKRFDSMRDTFIEIIFEVAASKNEQDNSLAVRSEFIGTFQREHEPLILLDGIEISSEYLLQLSPFLVEKIEILPRVYFIGGYTVNGIISVHTFKNDFTDQSNETIIRLEPPQSGGEAVLKTVNLEKNRYPDLESLLYWNPNLNHTGEKLEIAFNSSGYSGVYQLSVKGISRSGRKIDVNRYFIVK